MPIVVDDATIRKVVELASATNTATPIEIAQTMVTEYLTGKGLTATVLTLITLNLACHFALLYQGGQLQRKEMGDSREAYAVETGEGLSATIYGQVAQSLDTSGTLQAISAPRRKAQFRTVGMADSYVQRAQPGVGDTNDVKG